MGKEPGKRKMLQWHPAFYAGLQIELEEDRENLIFENEHQLGTKPKEIDVLVIKKEKVLPVHKNIGRIFRKYNIVEYKSPEDYLSVDDFYKVYAYVCFFKADSTKENEIPPEELTMSLVCARYPGKLMHHLQKQRAYTVQEEEAGIYYIKGDYFPIQIIVTSELDEKENLWLKNLTNEIPEWKTAEKLVGEYAKHSNENLYRSVMDVIVRANREKFREVKEMCDALMELMKDELEEAREAGEKAGIKAGIKVGRADGIKVGRAAGMQDGIKVGRAAGIRTGKMDGIIEMCREFGLDRESTVRKIMEKLGLSKENAEESVGKYW